PRQQWIGESLQVQRAVVWRRLILDQFRRYVERLVKMEAPRPSVSKILFGRPPLPSWAYGVDGLRVMRQLGIEFELADEVLVNRLRNREVVDRDRDHGRSGDERHVGLPGPLATHDVERVRSLKHGERF